MGKTLKSFANVKDAILGLMFLFLLNCLLDLSIILSVDIRFISSLKDAVEATWISEFCGLIDG